MTPGSSVGPGLVDRPAALDSRGHGNGMTGLPAEAAAPACRRVGDARVPGAARGTDPLTDPRPVAAGGIPGKDAGDPDR